MADALAMPRADQSAKPELSEPEILLLLNRVIAEENSVSIAPAREHPQSPSDVFPARAARAKTRKTEPLVELDAPPSLQLHSRSTTGVNQRPRTRATLSFSTQSALFGHFVSPREPSASYPARSS